MNMMKQQFPEQEQLKCPRCESSNTKFCYYNNYNLSQPRHFCKSCRRYWTKGGSLRNIPVGGGTRKNAKRPKRHNPDPQAQVSSPQASAADHDPTRVQSMNPNGPAPDSGLNPGLDGSESFLLQSGESGFWGGPTANGWPDLAIYTPGSSYE